MKKAKRGNISQKAQLKTIKKKKSNSFTKDNYEDRKEDQSEEAF